MSGKADLAVRYSRAVAGWLAVLIAVGGLLGFVFVHQQAPFCLFCDGRQPKPSCLPELGWFGEIQSRCQLAVIGWLWFVSLGLPRLFISAPCLTIALALDAIRGRYDTNGTIILPAAATLSLVPLVVYMLAYRCWRRRAPLAGALIGATIVLDTVLYIGWLDTALHVLR